MKILICLGPYEPFKINKNGLYRECRLEKCCALANARKSWGSIHSSESYFDMFIVFTFIIFVSRLEMHQSGFIWPKPISGRCDSLTRILTDSDF